MLLTTQTLTMTALADAVMFSVAKHCDILEPALNEYHIKLKSAVLMEGQGR